MNIEGKKIVLTGAASGIGKCLLERLLKIKGVTVVAADRNNIEVNGNYPNLHIMSCDLSGPEGIDELFQFALSRMNGIDLFFANAGFAYYEKIGAPDYAHIESIFKINVFAPIYIAEKMKELNGDRDYKVVMTASAMGKLALPGYSLYSATKAAVVSFSEAYPYELNSSKKISIVCPIATKTSFFKNAGDKTPVPFPAQTAEAVTDSIIKGVYRDKKVIYPSFIFILLLVFGSVFPFIKTIYASYMNTKFQKWLDAKK
ncbi:SDR family NAD(P)-dependent oxidoreductase [Paenibacillus sp. CAU 1782]